MNTPDYHTKFNAHATADAAFNAICKVADWWANDYEGNSEKLNDKFTIRFGETRTDFELTRFIPFSKIVWQVTGCHLHWLHDKKEWLGHTLIFDITPHGDDVTVEFTQIGLTPVAECYNDCEKGWNFYIGESLKKLIETGKGKPDIAKAER